MPSTDASFPGWWQCRAHDEHGTPTWLAAAAATAERTDGMRLELPEAQARAEVGDDTVGFVHYAWPEVVRIAITATWAPKAPPLWFAELNEPAATPPAANLVAFEGHGIEDGTLLDRVALREVGVETADQLGAIRWYPATGEMDQVYVSPAWRRRSIATTLFSAAALLNIARDQPRLWSDGQRTAMGDRLRNAGPWAHRAADLTHLAPPMTPFEDR